MLCTTQDSFVEGLQCNQKCLTNVTARTTEIISDRLGTRRTLKNLKEVFKKSSIRETKHLSTDADGSTDAIGGWTKNTPKPDFFEKRKNHPKRKKSKTSRDMPK